MKKIVIILFFLMLSGSEDAIKIDALMQVKITQISLLKSYFEGIYKDFNYPNEQIYFPANYSENVQKIMDSLKKEVNDIENMIYSGRNLSILERKKLKQNLVILKRELKNCITSIENFLDLINDPEKNISFKLSQSKEEINNLIETIEKMEIKLDSKNKIIAKVNDFQANKNDIVLKKQLEYILSLPWDKSVELNTDFNDITKKLDDTHNGLKEVKDQILDYIAVTSNTGYSNAPVICLVGAPGVGKTTIAQSIAKALNIPFEMVSMGGIYDESEVRGFNATYQGARPGRFVDAIKHAGVNNPLILIDEIDKVTTTSHHGNPQAALLELLDPSQNNNFRDNFLEVGFDFSKTFFIATANSLEGVSEPLLNRMLILNLSSYSMKEKLNIAQNYLIKKVMDKVGLKDFSFSDEVIKHIIDRYTYEGGVRQLEKMLRVICSRVVRERLYNNFKTTVTIDEIKDYLGDSHERNKNQILEPTVGRISGLAVGGYRGSAYIFELAKYPGKGEIIFTGQQGDVMKESINVALSSLISQADKLGLNIDDIKNSNLHFNIVIDGPVDGPSAGAAFFTLLSSVFLNKPIDQNAAITGKVNLFGDVLAIGGVREKLSGAEKHGVKKVLIPEQNRFDYEKVKDEFPDLEVILVSNVQEVLSHLLK